MKKRIHPKFHAFEKGGRLQTGRKKLIYIGRINRCDNDIGYIMNNSVYFYAELCKEFER
jgi:hypothetical protein